MKPDTKMLTSVVSYPSRGKGGDPRFWGNCSPRLLEDLFCHYRPRLVYDPAVGSGTTRDVAERLGIPGFFSDLALGFNVLRDEPPFGGFDFAFWHPPYHNIVVYTGPGSVWGGDPHPDDLSRCPSYEVFLERLNEATYRIYEALRRGGRLAVLVGDLRRNGKLYPIQRDMRWFGEPEALIIKMQHNTRSGRKDYGRARFVAIVHEYLVVTRKPDAWVVPLRVTEVQEADTRRFPGATWQAIVYGALEELGGEAGLRDIYGVVSRHARTRKAQAAGTDWRAVVRRELQTRPHFARVRRGVWRLVEPRVHRGGGQ